MKPLRFATKRDAIQYLSDSLGRSIRIADVLNPEELEQVIDKAEEENPELENSTYWGNKTKEIVEGNRDLHKKFDDLLAELLDSIKQSKEILRKHDEEIARDKNINALWEESNMNSQMDILRMDEGLSDQEDLSDEIMFETEIDAIQYLSDLLGKNITIQE